jgi:hypothetical protein
VRAHRQANDCATILSSIFGVTNTQRERESCSVRDRKLVFSARLLVVVLYGVQTLQDFSPKNTEMGDYRRGLCCASRTEQLSL